MPLDNARLVEDSLTACRITRLIPDYDSHSRRTNVINFFNNKTDYDGASVDLEVLFNNDNGNGSTGMGKQAYKQLLLRLKRQPGVSGSSVVVVVEGSSCSYLCRASFVPGMVVSLFITSCWLWSVGRSVGPVPLAGVDGVGIRYFKSVLSS